MRPFQLAFLPLLYVEYCSSSVFYVTLSFHFISATFILHLSPTHHIKTSHVFFVYVPNFTLLFISYNLCGNLSKDIQQYAQYRTDKCETFTQSVHILKLGFFSVE